MNNNEKDKGKLISSYEIIKKFNDRNDLIESIHKKNDELIKYEKKEYEYTGETKELIYSLEELPKIKYKYEMKINKNKRIEESRIEENWTISNEIIKHDDNNRIIFKKETEFNVKLNEIISETTVNYYYNDQRNTYITYREYKYRDGYKEIEITKKFQQNEGVLHYRKIIEENNKEKRIYWHVQKFDNFRNTIYEKNKNGYIYKAKYDNSNNIIYKFEDDCEYFFRYDDSNRKIYKKNDNSNECTEKIYKYDSNINNEYSYTKEKLHDKINNVIKITENYYRYNEEGICIYEKGDTYEKKLDKGNKRRFTSFRDKFCRNR